MERKHKVGDKVRIKSLDWYYEHRDKSIVVLHDGFIFDDGNARFCGKKATIESLSMCGGYTIDVDKGQNIWTDDMFEDTDNEITEIEKDYSYSAKACFFSAILIIVFAIIAVIQNLIG